MTGTATTKDVTEPLFRLAARTPLNIAPERGQELAAQIFGNGKWQLLPSQTAANFYAVSPDKAIYLSYAGLASLWCVSYARFTSAIPPLKSNKPPKAPVKPKPILVKRLLPAKLRLTSRTPKLSSSRIRVSHRTFPDLTSMPSSLQLRGV